MVRAALPLTNGAIARGAAAPVARSVAPNATPRTPTKKLVAVAITLAVWIVRKPLDVGVGTEFWLLPMPLTLRTRNGHLTDNVVKIRHGVRRESVGCHGLVEVRDRRSEALDCRCAVLKTVKSDIGSMA